MSLTLELWSIGIAKMARPMLPALPRYFFRLGFFRAWGDQFSRIILSVCVQMFRQTTKKNRETYNMNRDTSVDHVQD